MSLSIQKSLSVLVLSSLTFAAQASVHIVLNKKKLVNLITLKNDVVSSKLCALPADGGVAQSHCPGQELKQVSFRDYARLLGLQVGNYNLDQSGLDQAKKDLAYAYEHGRSAPDYVVMQKFYVLGVTKALEARADLEGDAVKKTFSDKVSGSDYYSKPFRKVKVVKAEFIEDDN